MSNCSDTSLAKTGAVFGECLLTTYPVQWTSSLLPTLVLKCIVVSVISVTATICNLLFIIAFRRTPSLDSIPNRLLSYLSMSDFLMSAVAMPLYVIRGVLVLCSMPSCIFFNTERFFIVLLSPASFSLLFLISFERFLAVVFPLKYSRWCSEKRINIWFAAALAFSVLFWPIMLWDLTLYYAVFGVIVCIIVVQILSIYAVLYRTVRTQRRRIRAQFVNWRAEDRNEKELKSRRVRFFETHEVGILVRGIVNVGGQPNRNTLAEAAKSTGINEAAMSSTGSVESKVNETEVKSTGSNRTDAKSTGRSETEVNWTKKKEKVKATENYRAEVKSTVNNIPEEQLTGNRKVDATLPENFKWDVKESFIFTLRLGDVDRKEILIVRAKKLDVKETGSRIPEIEETRSHTSKCVNYTSGLNSVVPGTVSKMEIKHCKAEKTIAIILSVMILCYLPAIVFVLYVLAAKASLYVRHSFGTWFEILVLLNCLCNPCIYYWKDRAIRRAVLHMLPNCFRKICPLGRP